MTTPLFILFILFLSPCNSQNAIEIKINYIDPDILTPIDISCDDFEKLFNSQIKTITIDKQSTIDSIVQIVNALKTDSTNRTIDVRIKIEIKFNDKTQIYCLNKMSIYSDGVYYILPKNFINMIRKYVN